jgi:glycosyltransferase involved in cell wall biosynthesis
MMANEKKDLNLVTLRSPTPARYSKLLKSLKKRYNVSLLTGTIVPTIHLRMGLTTALTYAFLFSKVTVSIKPTIIDVNALFCTSLRMKKTDLIIDFRTPFSYEMSWLGHGLISSVHRIFEKTIGSFRLITAANDLMADYCIKLGASNVKVIPNYPSVDFKPNTSCPQWRAQYHLPTDSKVALFSGGVRLKEIYGLDLLLDSWRIIEKSDDTSYLVILGDESVNYIRRKSKLLGLKRVLLPGRVSSHNVANWINCADLCLAPRTPGFSSAYYNDKDSTKIAEYAAFQKPIVATGYASSNQYTLVNSNSPSFSEGILRGLEGKIPESKPHFWEENEEELFSGITHFLNFQ